MPRTPRPGAPAPATRMTMRTCSLSSPTASSVRASASAFSLCSPRYGSCSGSLLSLAPPATATPTRLAATATSFFRSGRCSRSSSSGVAARTSSWTPRGLVGCPCSRGHRRARRLRCLRPHQRRQRTHRRQPPTTCELKSDARGARACSAHVDHRLRWHAGGRALVAGMPARRARSGACGAARRRMPYFFCMNSTCSGAALTAVSRSSAGAACCMTMQVHSLPPDPFPSARPAPPAGVARVHGWQALEVAGAAAIGHWTVFSPGGVWRQR
mmetsp:Transcript_105353/g.303015  ORF Transcript_105353/g.303015 Transcript_105353/m.303015 type:complete len:270 (-) Transcript_105353:124-933(-)